MKQHVPKQWNIFYQQIAGGWAKLYQKRDAREEKCSAEKMWERKDHNKKDEWINNMQTELQMLKEGPQVNIHSYGLQGT